MWFDINDYADFDWDDAQWYAEPNSEIWYYGQSDDQVNWTICPGYDCEFRVTMCKPGYAVDGKWDDYGPDYEDPILIEEFNDLDEAANFIYENQSVDW